MSKRWNLYAGDTLVAQLEVTGGDFPWLEAKLKAAPDFEPLRPLFAEEAEASEAEDWDRADALYHRIRAATRLTDPDGKDVAEYLLHIQGDEAWWRWSDEPFDQD